MISRDEAFAQGFRLAWRYCPIVALVAVCLLLFPAFTIAVCLFVFILYSALCGAEGRILR